MIQEEENKYIWTIGHSTRTIEEFILMLKSFNVEVSADVRNFPGSRKFPHFNMEALAASLHEAGINYIHFKELGGRRSPSPDSINTAWRHKAFRGYADYMQTGEFLAGIERLVALALKRRTALMCSEAVWWSCHRSLISDFLKADGWKVMHIMAAEKATEHPYTSPAKLVNGRLNYEGEE